MNPKIIEIFLIGQLKRPQKMLHSCFYIRKLLQIFKGYFSKSLLLGSFLDTPVSLHKIKSIKSKMLLTYLVYFSHT